MTRRLATSRACPKPTSCRHERFGSEEGDTAALLRKLSVVFPLGEDPAGSEIANVREGTQLLVGDVDGDSRVSYFAGGSRQLNQPLREPRLRVLGNDVGVT